MFSDFVVIIIALNTLFSNVEQNTTLSFMPESCVNPPASSVQSSFKCGWWCDMVGDISRVANIYVV